VTQSYACPACGGHVPLPDVRVQTVYCPYCAQPVVALPSGFDPRGGRARLAETPTVVRIGEQALIDGQTWDVVGRVQYRFEAGLFDHFYLVALRATPQEGGGGEPPGGVDAWLEQDEGELRLYTRLEPVAEVPAWDDLAVGERIRVAGGSFYAMEIGEGAVVGGAGALPMALLPGEPFSYVDGTLDGRAASLKYSPGAAWLLVGRTLATNQVRAVRRTPT
jgi:hypothetical protein